MTKIFKSIFLLVVLLFIGCSSSDDTDNFSGESFMRANIDGNSWESSTIEISVLNVFSTSNFQQLSIRGANSDIKISLAVNEFNVSECATVGTYSGVVANMDYGYSIGNDNFVFEYFNDPSGNTLQSDTVINITQCDNGLVSGTFSGTLFKVGDNTDTISITDGVFQNISFDLVQN